MKLVKKLDVIFSRYIRLRDAFSNGKFICISCGRVKDISQADCGHFISRKNMATRFDERNCNAECRECNRFDNEHLVGYQQRLMRKIGESEFYNLLFLSHTIKKWDADELNYLIKLYSAKAAKEEHEKGIKL